MATTCGLIQEFLLEARGAVSATAPGVREHLGACEPCAAFARRTASIGRTLSDLSRLPAPRELDGLVVAATQAGFREDRVARSVRLLSRLSPPSELDARPVGYAAPRVLDRLVDEDLRKLGAETTRRFASRSDRKLVSRPLTGPVEASPTGPRSRTAGRRRARWGIALATGLSAVALGAIGWLAFERRDAGVPEDTGPEIVVVYQSSLDSMDPMARSLLAGFTSGALDASSAEGRR